MLLLGRLSVPVATAWAGSIIHKTCLLPLICLFFLTDTTMQGIRSWGHSLLPDSLATIPLINPYMPITGAFSFTSSSTVPSLAEIETLAS